MSRDVPAGLGAVGAAVLAGVGVVGLAGQGWLATGLGVLGVVAVAAAYPVESPGLATVGGASLFATVLVSGAFGLGTPSVVVSGVAAFLSWTFGRTAAGLRHDLGDAPAGQLELTHVAGTTALAVTGAIVTFVPYLLGQSEIPPLGLVAFVVGGVLLAMSLREGE